VALVASPNQLNSFIGMFWIFYNVFVEFLIDFENDLGVLESFYLLFFVEFALEDFLNFFFFNFILQYQIGWELDFFI